MANKNEATPKDYDRWGKMCVKITSVPTKKEEKPPKKAVKTVKKGK